MSVRACGAQCKWTINISSTFDATHTHTHTFVLFNCATFCKFLVAGLKKCIYVLSIGVFMARVTQVKKNGVIAQRRVFATTLYYCYGNTIFLYNTFSVWFILFFFFFNQVTLVLNNNIAKCVCCDNTNVFCARFTTF